MFGGFTVLTVSSCESSGTVGVVVVVVELSVSLTSPVVALALASLIEHSHWVIGLLNVISGS